MADRIQRITPFLWFNDDAEAAVRFYVSVFKNARIGQTTRYTKESSEASGQPAGSVMTIAFELDGQQFTAINGGPHFKFTEAVSFVVNCDSQDEIDHYWDKLSEGGETQQCGWLKDRFGLSWQIVPSEMPHLMGNASPAQSQKMMEAVMTMTKLNIAALKQAYEQAA